MNDIQPKRVTLAKRKTTLYRKAEELALRTGYYTRVEIYNTNTKSKLSYISSNTPRDFFADDELVEEIDDSVSDNEALPNHAATTGTPSRLSRNQENHIRYPTLKGSSCFNMLVFRPN